MAQRSTDVPAHTTRPVRRTSRVVGGTAYAGSTRSRPTDSPGRDRDDR